jgi:hypothetical protein
MSHETRLSVLLSAVDNASAEIKNVERSLGSLGVTTEQLTRVNNSYRDAVKEANKEIRFAQQEYRVMNYEALQGVDAMKRIGSIGGQLTTMWQAYNVAQIRVQQATDAVTKAQEAYTKALEEFGAASPKTKKALDDLTDAQNKAKKASDEVAAGMVGMGFQAVGVAGQVGQLVLKIRELRDLGMLGGLGGAALTWGPLAVGGVAAMLQFQKILELRDKLDKGLVSTTEMLEQVNKMFSDLADGIKDVVAGIDPLYMAIAKVMDVTGAGEEDINREIRRHIEGYSELDEASKKLLEDEEKRLKTEKEIADVAKREKEDAQRRKEETQREQLVTAEASVNYARFLAPYLAAAKAQKIGLAEYLTRIGFPIAEIPTNIRRAFDIPEAQLGGTVEKTGPVLVHRGETIVPAGDRGGSMNLHFHAPLVNIEGSADRATAEYAAKLVEDKLRSVVLEATSSSAPATSKRIRTQSRIGGLG